MHALPAPAEALPVQAVPITTTGLDLPSLGHLLRLVPLRIVNTPRRRPRYFTRASPRCSLVPATYICDLLAISILTPRYPYNARRYTRPSGELDSLHAARVDVAADDASFALKFDVDIIIDRLGALRARS